jgi:anti-sigma-K factor RskA
MEPADHLSDDELADLARLADGTLPVERRAEVEARVAASPQLASIVERQGATLDAVGGLGETGAPARLRADVDRRRAGGGAAAGGRPRRVIAGVIAAAAAAAVAAAIVLPGLSDDPTVGDAYALSLEPPAQAAPARDPGAPQRLNADVDGVAFPNYEGKFGWEALSAREDELSGRDATTVYYERDGRTIAYTIVAGDALDPPSDTRTTERGGVEYRTFREDDRIVVTWERGGHTCVLSGDSIDAKELVALADWRGQGAVTF